MTFEDWTDVMYDTMKATLFMSSIVLHLLYAAFLNMVIGTWPFEDDMEESAEKDEEEGNASLNDLRDEIQELKRDRSPRATEQ